jgi:hypothetical protein
MYCCVRIVYVSLVCSCVRDLQPYLLCFDYRVILLAWRIQGLLFHSGYDVSVSVLGIGSCMYCCVHIVSVSLIYNCVHDLELYLLYFDYRANLLMERIQGLLLYSGYHVSVSVFRYHRCTYC